MTVTVTFVQRDGKEIVVEGSPQGESLMEVARGNDVEGILGDCGGNCACATCHVYIDPDWQEIVGPVNDVEALTLEMVAGRHDNSRLGCQVRLTAALDGLKVTVAEEA